MEIIKAFYLFINERLNKINNENVILVMRKYIIFLLVTLWGFETHGQQLSIELSVEWKKEETEIYHRLNSPSTPFLIIVFNNLSNDSIYIPKIYKNKYYLPQLSPAINISGDDIIDLIRVISPDTKHNVFIGGTGFNTVRWEVLPDSVDYYSEHEYDVINEILADVYNYVYQPKGNLTDINDLSNAITEQNIVNVLKDNFVFLPPNSKYVESYSLAGFKILGGCYTFLLTGSEIKDFVHFGPTRDPQLQDWVYYDVIFPDMINNYRLYGGEFYTNKVDVTFKKSPDL